MFKKVLAILLTIIMLSSMLLLSSCDDKKGENDKSEEEIVLTPKLLTTAAAAAAYLKELSDGLGYSYSEVKAVEGKTPVTTFDAELKKLSYAGTDIISDPIKITVKSETDQKNNITKSLLELGADEAKLPVEILNTKSGIYFEIDKVTEEMLKFPYEEEMPDFDLEQIRQIIDTYSDTFMDNLPSELFTEEKGDVTVDGVAISNATTIKAQITSAQLMTAIKAVLVQAKTDLQLKKVADNLKSMLALYETDQSTDSYEEAIDEAIDQLDDDIEDAKEGDYLTIAVIFEDENLRSVNLEVYEKDEKCFAAALTTVKKDSGHYVKGSVSGKDEEKFFDFSYEQTANDAGSADGKFSIGVSDEMELTVEFKGTKTENKLVVDSDIEMSVHDGGEDISIPIKVTSTYEKVSDTENSVKADLSIDALDYDIELSIGSSVKLADYTEITAPGDDDAEILDEEFDFQALIQKILVEYPDVYNYLSNYLGSEEQTGIYLYNQYQTICLNYDGSGSLVSSYTNMSYGNGKYTAEFMDEEYSGTYSVNGSDVTIDGFGGYTLQEFDYCDVITDSGETIIITVYDDCCDSESPFEYTLEDDVLDLTFKDGETASYDCVEAGDVYTVGGVEFYWDYLYD